MRETTKTTIKTTIFEKVLQNNRWSKKLPRDSKNSFKDLVQRFLSKILLKYFFKDGVRRFFKDCSQRLCPKTFQLLSSKTMFKCFVQRSCSTMFLHNFTLLARLLFFLLFSLLSSLILSFSPSLRCEKAPLSDTGQISIQDNSFAMLYNLCYAMPLYMCPNSGLIDTLLLYTDMHFSRYSDEITPSICWNRSQKKRHCTLNQKRHKWGRTRKWERTYGAHRKRVFCWCGSGAHGLEAFLQWAYLVLVFKPATMACWPSLARTPRDPWKYNQGASHLIALHATKKRSNCSNAVLHEHQMHSECSHSQEEACQRQRKDLRYRCPVSMWQQVQLHDYLCFACLAANTTHLMHKMIRCSLATWCA